MVATVCELRVAPAGDPRRVLGEDSCQTMTAMDQSLLQRVAAGDPTAVQAVIDRYGSLVWSIARSMIPDRSQAEDVVQEVFIAVWRSAARYDPEVASEATFIATIARRRLIDRLRKRERYPQLEVLEDEVVEVSDDALEHVDTSDEAARAAEALKRLRPEERRVISMSVVGGLSHQKIADATGLPLGTVKSHVRRGLERVRQMLATSRTGTAGEATS